MSRALPRTRKQAGGAPAWPWWLACVALIAAVSSTWLDARPQRQASSAPLRARHEAAARSRSFQPPARALPMLSGRVLEGTAGHEGARVCVSRRGSDERDRSTCVLAGADGGYTFARVPDGNYAVTASAAGFALSRALDGAWLELHADASHEHVDIVLRRGEARVSGFVTDALGGPIAQAHLRVLQAVAGKSASVELQTSADGSFEVWTDRGALMLVAESDGYAPALANVIAPSRGVLLSLMPEAIVRGRVVFEGDDRPIEGAKVSAVPLDPRLTLHRSTLSAPEGGFELRGLEPGAYELLAEGPHLRGGASEPIFVQLGETLGEQIIRVAPAVVVSGRITIGDSKPCNEGALALWPTAGADPRGARPWLAPTDEHGEARIEGVPAGRYSVFAQCRDHVQQGEPLVIDVGSEDIAGLALQTQPGLGLGIAVRDRRGEAVRGASIGIVMPSHDASETKSLMSCTSDANGRCELPRNLRPGSYSIEPLDGYRAEPVRVELREGMGTVEVVLELEGAAYVLVAVQTPGGEPIDGVEVSARSLDTDTMVYANALGDGQYRLGPIAEGAYEARADDGRSAPVTALAPLDARASSMTNALIVLDRSAALRGRVLDGRGAPAANTWVSVQHAAAMVPPLASTAPGASTRALTDLDGVFELQGLQPGALYDVRALAPSGETAQHGGAHAGDTVELQLDRLAEGSSDAP